MEITENRNENCDKETKNVAKLDPTLFEAAERNQFADELTRPSLTYWEDAWIRLKKNKKALVSLYLVIGLLLFSLMGPFVWKVDPNKQNLNFISQTPSFGKSAVVAEDYEMEQVILDDFPESPEEEVDELAASSKITVTNANTIFVSFKWEPVKGSSGYNIYRNEHEPVNNNDLGVPLGEVEGGNIVSYVDRLKIEPRDYWYSVVANDGSDEAEVYTTIHIKPDLALTLDIAKDYDSNAVIGSTIKTQSHPFGTDYLGRDILARLMEGGRISFFIGICAPLIYILFGTLYGGFAGFVGGRVDGVLMRFSDFVVALPFLLFMILFKVVLGSGPGESGIIPMVIALVILAWPGTARLVRGQVLQLREQGYTQAARLLGAKPFYILLRHMLPNTVGVILVTLTFAIPSGIFTEAFLSFIGMGVAPPNPSWGVMCNEGVKTMLNSPHELLFPAITISLTVLAFNLLGDGLRDALDSKMRSKE